MLGRRCRGRTAACHGCKIQVPRAQEWSSAVGRMKSRSLRRSGKECDEPCWTHIGLIGAHAGLARRPRAKDNSDSACSIGRSPGRLTGSAEPSRCVAGSCKRSGLCCETAGFHPTGYGPATWAMASPWHAIGPERCRAVGTHDPTPYHSIETLHRSASG